jgi:predicted nucleic acid-binding protein
MEKLFADTNIFGIAVDREDSRRESVWRILKRVASGEVELHTAQIVVEEIKQVLKKHSEYAFKYKKE